VKDETTLIIGQASTMILCKNWPENGAENVELQPGNISRQRHSVRIPQPGLVKGEGVIDAY
jgi:hypothetical protein